MRRAFTLQLYEPNSAALERATVLYNNRHRQPVPWFDYKITTLALMAYQEGDEYGAQQITKLAMKAENERRKARKRKR